jgi:small subunit ribosomal protein S17
MTNPTTRPEKKRVRGVVKSSKMDKTITVRIERLVKHPIYAKYIKRGTTYMAHDAHEDAREGDVVEIENIRPLSKRKCWRLVRIVRRAPAGLVEVAEQ